MNNELYHHGVLGMKWGVRRYQPYRESNKNEKEKKKQHDKQYSKIFQETSKTARSISAAKRKYDQKKVNKQKAKAAADIDVSHLTNKELQDYITRQNLERQYKSLKTEYIVSGRDRVADVLDIAGDILAVGASAASLAVAIYTLKH